MKDQQFTHPSVANGELFIKTIQIHAPVSNVWQALTVPKLMNQWMAEETIEILTDWQVGAPIVLRGKSHGVRFENKGTVLQFEPETLLQYSHLSSLSRLPDKVESYSLFEFRLTPVEDETSLTLTLTNFPTETIYKHLAFYWNVTLELLKRMLEKE